MVKSEEILVPHVGWLTHESGDEVAWFLHQGWFESAEQAMVWLYGRAGDTVVDVGAHVGLFSVLGQRVVLPGGRVVSVEPSAATAELLRRNVGEAGTVIEAAAGEQSGRQPLHQAGAGRSAYNTLGGGNAPTEAATAPIVAPSEDPPAPSSVVSADAALDAQVRVITLDELFDELEIQRADFVKIDVEGFELAVWRGARRTIGRGAMPLAMIEFTEPNLQRAGTSSRELFEAIAADGYTLCRFDPESMRLVTVSFDQPIWYDNLFATTELDAVNARLGEATSQRRRIAADVLARGRAGRVAQEAEAIQRRLSDLQADRDAAYAAAEKVREDLRQQIELRDQSYAAHKQTRETLHQTQEWLRVTTDRAELAEGRAADLGRELAELRVASQAQINRLEQQLLAFCTSKYEQMSWRIGVRKKPDWVDPFVQRMTGEQAAG